MAIEDHPSYQAHLARVIRAREEYLNNVDRVRTAGQTFSLFVAFNVGQLVVTFLFFGQATGWPVLAGLCTAYFYAQWADRREAVAFQREAEKLLQN